jgi:steroid delta-isomerase-like uncharacterized protein
MSIADRKALTQRIFDTFNTRDAAATAGLFDPQATLEDVAVPRRVVGTAAIAAVYERHFAAIPDAYVRVERMVAEGETVVAEWTSAGTHLGPLMGIPATGRALSVKGVSIIRFRGTTPVADTRVWDLAGLLRQIGLLPSRSFEHEPAAPTPAADG